MGYGEAWALQRALVAARQAGHIGDAVLFVEHPPVITIGRSGRAANILTPREFLGARGVEVFELAGVLGVQSARLPVLALDGFVHLLTVYGDFDGGRDPQPNLVAPDIHHGDDDVVTDDDTLVAVSGQQAVPLRKQVLEVEQPAAQGAP